MAHATIKDVAKAAGVAIATASRALNNRDGVSKDTRKRVLRVAEELGYVPNSLARGLLSGQTRTVGVIVTSILNPFYAAVVAGIEDYLSSRGYNIALYSSNEDPKRELASVRALFAQRADGIILAPVESRSAAVEYLASSSMPFTLVARNNPDLDTDYVVCDDVAVGRMATEHLIARGHRHIMLINSSLNSSAVLRRQGYELALRESGLEVDDRLVRSVVLGSHAEQAMSQALDEGVRPSAVFCFCDSMALGVLRVLRQRGIRVPDDMAVVGCDNLDYTEFLDPPLTTIDIPKHEMGVQAASVLLSKVRRQRKRPLQAVLTPFLVQRSSA